MGDADMIRLLAKDDSTGVRGRSTTRRGSERPDRLFPTMPEGVRDPCFSPDERDRVISNAPCPLFLSLNRLLQVFILKGLPTQSIRENVARRKDKDFAD